MISKYKQGSDDYLMELADNVISKLVHEKKHLFKAYNYYLGFRDKYQFEHLEKNYGVGNPTSIKFTPLIRKHIDAIVGEYLSTKIQPKISCKDRATLSNILRDKLLEVSKEIHEYVKLFLDNAIYEAIMGKLTQDEKALDQEVLRQLKDIEESVNLNFISNYEIAALNIIQYILQSRNIDFKNKMQQVILDLLIAGECYYKAKPTPSKKNLLIEVDDPLNTFVFKNPGSKYMKNGTMSVVRKWLTREEISIRYGKELSKEDIESLEAFTGYASDDDNFTWIAAVNSRGCARTKGILAGQEVHVEDDYFMADIELIPVYEVEWIDYDREKEKGILYSVTRIGEDIYILDGENKDVSRSYDDPDNIRLSINGMYYTTRTGVPFSLMLATADLLDLYDLTLFQKDNLVAQAGTKGAHVDMGSLPAWLGETPLERLVKYLGYRKTGLSLIAPNQDGNDVQSLNTIYNGFDDTLSYQAMLGYLLSLQMIEDIASSITGVFRERLGGIEQRDAVANVEVGMQQSYIITKLYYQAMDTIVAEILIDSLDLAKKVYKKGLTGEIILGNKKLIFTLLPEYYSVTDYDLHLADSAELIKEMDLIKQMAIQLAGQGLVDPEILLIVSTSKSLTELNDQVRKSILAKKLENNQLAQLSQQLEQAQQQINQMLKQLEADTKKIAQLNERKMNLDHESNVMDQNIAYYKINTEKELKEKELNLIKERNQLEGLQLIDNQQNNNEIANKKV